MAARTSQLGKASLGSLQLGSLDSGVAAGNLTREVSDTIVLSDSAVIDSEIRETAQNDSFTLNDELSTQLFPVPLDFAFTDTLTITDALLTEYVLVPHYYDSLESFWADGVQVSLGQGIAVSDTLAFLDALSLSSGYALLFSDNFTVSDNLTLFFTLTYEASDLLSLLDAILVSEQGHGVLDDSFSLTDDISVSLGTQLVVELTATVSDTIALSDAIRVQKPYPMKNYLRRYLNDVELV